MSRVESIPETHSFLEEKTVLGVRERAGGAGSLNGHRTPDPTEGMPSPLPRPALMLWVPARGWQQLPALLTGSGNARATPLTTLLSGVNVVSDGDDGRDLL